MIALIPEKNGIRTRPGEPVIRARLFIVYGFHARRHCLDSYPSVVVARSEVNGGIATHLEVVLKKLLGSDDGVLVIVGVESANELPARR